MEQFHEMLTYVKRRIFYDKDVSFESINLSLMKMSFESIGFGCILKFKRLKTIPEYEDESLTGRLNSLNLQLIKEKVNDERYESTVEFMKDIQIIRHNAEIVFPGE